jgi:hypothetical protein
VNTITDLRDLLFDALRGVKNGTLDPKKAAAIFDGAQVIVNSAKVECEHMKITGMLGSGFIPITGEIPAVEPDEEPLALTAPGQLLNEETSENHEENDEPETPGAQRQDDDESEPEHEISEVAGFKAGDRVFLPSGKKGTVKSVTTAGRINVELDGDAGVLPYSARHLQTDGPSRQPVTSPVVPAGPRVVQGRYGR